MLAGTYETEFRKRMFSIILSINDDFVESVWMGTARLFATPTNRG